MVCKNWGGGGGERDDHAGKIFIGASCYKTDMCRLSRLCMYEMGGTGRKGRKEMTSYSSSSNQRRMALRQL